MTVAAQRVPCEMSMCISTVAETSDETLLSLCACRIPVVVVRCEFWDRSRNLLSTSCVSDPCRCGAVRILRSLAQPSQHFVRVGSLSLWRGANFWDRSRNLLSRSCQEVSYRDLAERACTEISSRPLLGNLYRDLAGRPFTEILYWEFAKRSLTEILPRELL